MTTPTWQQLKAILQVRIASSEYGPRILTPSENEMMRESSMSRSALQKALATLRYEG